MRRTLLLAALAALLTAPAAAGEIQSDFDALEGIAGRQVSNRDDYNKKMEQWSAAFAAFVETWEARADEGSNRLLLGRAHMMNGRFNLTRLGPKALAPAKEHVASYLQAYPDDAAGLALSKEITDLETQWAKRLQLMKKKTASRAQNDEQRQALVGKPAPALELTEVLDEEELITLAGLRGKVVVLDFWATWCGPCRRVIPHLVELKRQHGEQGLEILGVTRFYTYAYEPGPADEAGQPTRGQVHRKIEPAQEREIIRKCAAAFDINYPIVFSTTAQKSYHVRGIPQLVVIGRDGAVKFVKVGAGDHSKLDEVIAECLGQEEDPGATEEAERQDDSDS